MASGDKQGRYFSAKKEENSCEKSSYSDRS